MQREAGGAGRAPRQGGARRSRRCAGTAASCGFARHARRPARPSSFELSLRRQDRERERREHEHAQRRRAAAVLRRVLIAPQPRGAPAGERRPHHVSGHGGHVRARIARARGAAAQPWRSPRRSRRRCARRRPRLRRPPPTTPCSGAQVVHALPATISGTVVGATVEPLEEPSGCAGCDRTLRLVLVPRQRQGARRDRPGGGRRARRDGRRVPRRSLGTAGASAATAPTRTGKASLTFTASKNGLYRSASPLCPARSSPGSRSRCSCRRPPSIRPGRGCRRGGASGRVDRIQNINAAYSVVMRSGVSYIVSLASKTPGACVSGGLFAPGTSVVRRMLAAHAHALRRLRPVHARARTGRRLQHPADPAQHPSAGSSASACRSRRRARGETAPGIAARQLRPRPRAARRQRRAGAAAVPAGHHQPLEPDAAAARARLGRLQPAAAQHRRARDRMPVRRQRLADARPPARAGPLLRGRLDARRKRSATSRSIRESRTITSTHISFLQRKVAAGQATPVDVKVSPSASGPVTVEIERFDPVFGWQFYRQETGFVVGRLGDAGVRAPAVGRWRVEGRIRRLADGQPERRRLRLPARLLASAASPEGLPGRSPGSSAPARSRAGSPLRMGRYTL